MCGEFEGEVMFCSNAYLNDQNKTVLQDFSQGCYILGGIVRFLAIMTSIGHFISIKIVKDV